MSRYSLGQRADPITARARAECGNGTPRCQRAPADGINPLGLCDVCLDAYPGHVSTACPRCVGVPGVPYVHVAGSMCFACGLTPGGTVATPSFLVEARGKMIRRLSGFVRAAERGALDLSMPWETGDRHTARVELAALLSRAPDDVGTRARAALARLGYAIDT